jgi:cardiolipin synthase A/B
LKMEKARTSQSPYNSRKDLYFLTDQAFSRAAGALLIPGNSIRLLKDAAENYPAWLEAIDQAEKFIHFESYIIHEDDIGRQFSEALREKARAGVRVRLIYDWLGGWRKTSRRFWRSLRGAGVEVRCFNPPRWRDPLGWIHRDHRKTLMVDQRLAFVTGLCVGKMWVGDPKKGLDPWRDTGVAIQGPAVADVAQAFADSWAEMGLPIPEEELPRPGSLPMAGNVDLRIVADTAFSTAAFRLDTLVAALAQERLWLADAYFAGTPIYVQALRAAARDGVDVRLLVPGKGSDIAIMQAISRAGYRSLLEAGVRVFEWNGSMMHAKTAVADGHWARVGSTNLNLASWVGNWELDVIVENQDFGQEMEDMYLEDLERATEIVLKGKRKVIPLGRSKIKRVKGAGGSAGRAVTGAVRIGHAIGSAMTAQRELGPAEASFLGWTSLILLLLTALAVFLPRAVAYPLAVIFFLLGFAFLTSAYRLKKTAKETALKKSFPKKEPQP